MEAVKTQDVGVNDLPWKIEYDANRCTMCGSCVASCTFKAIKVEVTGDFLRVWYLLPCTLTWRFP